MFRLEQEREKLGSELSEAQNIYMQSLEDVKVSRVRCVADTDIEKACVTHCFCVRRIVNKSLFFL